MVESFQNQQMLSIAQP